MKTTLLVVLTLFLTGLDLWAQPQPGPFTPPRRPMRYGSTNQPPGAPRFPGAQAPLDAQGNPIGGPGSAARNRLPGAPGVPGAPGNPGAGGQAQTSDYNASAAFASKPEEMIAPGTINFEGVDVSQVLDIYAKLVNRTLLRGALPQAQIVLNTQTELTKTETIEALQAVLALNGISLVNIGDKFVKVLASDQAGTAGGEIDRSGSTNIPALGSYVTHVIQLRYVKPSEMVPVIQPFSKLANSILPIDGNGILVLRDYAENVKRMLEMIEEVDVNIPAVYISEVVPIRYAKVDDIANALNALGGGGGAITSIGSSASSSTISGLGNRSGGGGFGSMGGSSGGYGNGIGGGGMGGMGGMGGNSSFNNSGSRTPTPNGTPNGGANSFQQRLNNIINATGGGSGGGSGSKQDIQLFGQTKIIPNESSSTLLIYATRPDMAVITNIIAKLDVPLQQVLIEAAIIDYSLGPNTFNFGASVAQNPVANGNFIGAGGVNNGNGSSPFMQFIQSVTTITNGLATNGTYQSLSYLKSITANGASVSNSVFGNNLPGGLGYFASIGPNWDVALTAAQSDSHASVIQRPRIQTSQAKPAQFFVGDTVPYVTGDSYGSVYGSGVSYSQLSVGVELDVTPFINPEGLVVMDVQQEIDDLNGYTTIQNVGQVPNTIKRTLNAEIAVRDRDTVMLGGFIKSDKSTSRSGVPFLMDIPIIGNLFLQRSDSKEREELIVLMRPTVLPTPEFAAVNTRKEEIRLPGVAGAEADNADEERLRIAAERKREMQKYKADHQYEGFYVPRAEDGDTNSVPIDLQRRRLDGNSTNAPDEQNEEVTPVQEVHPQAGLVPAAGTPATPGTPAPAGNAAPPDAAAMQQKAQAALSQKMMELNSTPPATPAH